jgi:DNA-directed RNA polymerase subunit H (RpoH/RPB5)
MEAVNAYFDGRTFVPEKPVTAKRNQRAIVTILDEAFTEPKQLPKINRRDLKVMMKGSITESLIGIVPDSGITLDEIRAERLSKYERID